MPIRLLSIMLACTAAAACGVTESNFAERYAEASCTRNLACCAGTPGLVTEAQCAAVLAAFAGSSFNAEFATGHVTFNSATAETCISDLENQPCGDYLAAPSPSSCFAVFTGSQAIGASCTFGDECASTACGGIQEDDDGHVTAPGTCATPGGPGQPCTPSNNSGPYCAAGSTIDYADYPSCTCIATLPNGSGCTVDNQCSSTYCDTMAGTCAAVPQISSLPASSCQSLLEVNYPQ